MSLPSPVPTVPGGERTLPGEQREALRRLRRQDALFLAAVIGSGVTGLAAAVGLVWLVGWWVILPALLVFLIAAGVKYEEGYKTEDS